MPGVTTRSKSRHEETNGEANGVITNGVITNGFHGYKEGYETLEKSGVSKAFRTLTDKFLFPLCLLTITPQMALLVWYTNAHCNGSYAELFSRLQEKSIMTSIVQIWRDVSIFNTFTICVVFGYFAWALFWMVVLPGKEVRGPVTPSGHTPVYKDNGFLHYVVTMAGFAALTVFLKMNGMSPSVVYDRFGELIAFMTIFALFFVLTLYFKGIYAPSTKDCGKSGSGFIFDYYWGTELYPRVWGVDIKVFTNCRVGMTIWPLLVCIFAIKSYELHGFVDSMAVTTILQLVYITKFFTWEAGYMCTIDIILDRAGYYICWGCLCWVPSLYPLVSQYLVSHPVKMGTGWALTVLMLGLISVTINYLVDLQRQVVRKSNGECLVWGKTPELIRAKYRIQNGEERESILLVSGWWGLSRHFHYVPEILLAFFWSLPTGFESILPYTYVIFLLVLLVHRSYRDDNKCSKKYGPYWKQYCEKVKHRIIPFLF